MKKLLLGALAACLLASRASATTITYSDYLVNETGISADTNYTFNRNHAEVDYVSAQAIYSSSTYSSKTFTDGTQAAGQFTITSAAGVKGVKGTNTITIVSNGMPSTATITLNGIGYVGGTDWTKGTVSSNTAVAIKNLFNSVSGFTASTPTATTVQLQCSSNGIYCNAYTLSVNTTSMTVTGATFSGGHDAVVIGINGITLVEGVDFTAVATASGTAKALSDAIMASPDLSAIVVSTWTSGVVYATSTAVGTSANYPLYSTIASSGTPSGSLTTVSGDKKTSVMTGGTAAGYTINSSVLTIASHGFTTALPVLYTGTPAIAGLTTTTTYYAIPVTANTIKLASSKANAQAGTAITITSSSTQTTAHTYTLAPIAISGTPSFKWQGSSDGDNWTDLSVSSVTLSSYAYGGTVTGWDFARVNYPYMRVNLTGPTWGAIYLRVRVTGTGRR
jgi:hypothetical protein